MELMALAIAFVLTMACTVPMHTVRTSIEVNSEDIRKESMHSLQAFIKARKLLSQVEAINYIMISDALVSWAGGETEVNRTAMLEMVNTLPVPYRSVAALMIEVVVFEANKILPTMATAAEKNYALGRIVMATHEGVVLAVAFVLQRTHSSPPDEARTQWKSST